MRPHQVSAVIGKILRGRDVGWLLGYLYGPGRRNEHLNPHLVASWDDNPAALEPSPLSTSRFDLQELTRRMEEPLAVATRLQARPVWHCAVRVAPSDRTLTDAEWGQIAQEIVHATGLAPRGDDYGCRWIAVRHAENHIHLFATLTRQDGVGAYPFSDFYQVAEVCHAAEQRLGLISSAPSDGSAARHGTRAEQEKASRLGRHELPRHTLQREVRTAAAAATTAEDFLARLRSAGLIHRLRYDERDPATATGYAVALPGDRGTNDRPVFFGGRQLAPDLSWPKLCCRWQDTAPAPPGEAGASSEAHDQPQRVIPSERPAAWRGAAVVSAVATLELAALSATDPQPGSDLASAAAGLISVVARAVEGRRGGRVTAAADAYDRAGREPNGRVPTPTPTGDRIRIAARLLAQVGRAGHQDTDDVHALIAALVDLVEAVAQLRDRQERPAQAVAARQSAQRLAAALPPQPTPSTGRTNAAAPTPSRWVDGPDERPAHSPPPPSMPSASPHRRAHL
jgi:hypothetical protein